MAVSSESLPDLAQRVADESVIDFNAWKYSQPSVLLDCEYTDIEVFGDDRCSDEFIIVETRRVLVFYRVQA